MVEYIQQGADRIQELWLLIDQLHLSYLHTEESPQKMDQRRKLEGYIREYLSLVPHDRKFSFRATSDIQIQSVKSKLGFSACTAGTGFDAIGIYASNLLAQPWRKEFKEIKLFGGFFMHQVEAILYGAEQLFEHMGYRHTPVNTLVLDGPVDPERVTAVARDCLMAYVECQVLMAIWESVTAKFPCSWEEVLEFRQDHVGSIEQAIRSILYYHHQQQYQEQMAAQIPHGHPPLNVNQYFYMQNHLEPACSFELINYSGRGYCHNHSNYAINHYHSLPHQDMYGTAHLPGIYSQSEVLKSHEFYQNGVHPYPVNMIDGSYGHGYQTSPVTNGYPLPSSHTNHFAQNSVGNTVPTGHLIDIDISNDFTQVEKVLLPKPVPIPKTIQHSHVVRQEKKANQGSQVGQDGADFVRSKGCKFSEDNFQPRTFEEHLEASFSVIKEKTDSGQKENQNSGSWENWEYVYRKLESKGYSKDLGERGDVLWINHGQNSLSDREKGEPNKSVIDSPTLPEENMFGVHVSSLEQELSSPDVESYSQNTGKQLEKPLTINEALQQISLDDKLRNTASCVINTHLQIQDQRNTGKRGSYYDNVPSNDDNFLIDSEGGDTSNTVSKFSKTLPSAPKWNREVLPVYKTIDSKNLCTIKENKNAKDANSKNTVIAANVLENQQKHTSSAEPEKEKMAPLTLLVPEKQKTPPLSKTLQEKQKTPPLSGFMSEKQNTHTSSALVPEKQKNDSSAVLTEQKVRSVAIPCKMPKSSLHVNLSPLLRSNSDIEKWECITCTYLNPPSAEICEMCGKSKFCPREIKPLVSGGRQCAHCTLVNEKASDVCDACGASLKDSPTYI